MTLHPDPTWPHLADAVLTGDLSAQRHAWTPEPVATEYVPRHSFGELWDRAVPVHHVPRHLRTLQPLIARFAERSAR